MVRVEGGTVFAASGPTGDELEVSDGHVNPIPDGYPRVIPYLSVDGADAAIAFYTRVLGATERMRMDAPGGKIGHAELAIGDSIVMLADAFPEMAAPRRWHSEAHRCR